MDHFKMLYSTSAPKCKICSKMYILLKICSEYAPKCMFCSKNSPNCIFYSENAPKYIFYSKYTLNKYINNISIEVYYEINTRYLYIGIAC